MKYMALMLVLAFCSTPDRARAGLPPDSDLPARLAEAERAWAKAGLWGYTYTIEFTFLACDIPRHVEVRGPRCTVKTSPSNRPKRSLCEDPEVVTTVQEMFQLIHDLIAAPIRTHAYAQFHPRYGYPTRI